MGCTQSSSKVAICTGPVTNPHAGAIGTLKITRPEGDLPKDRSVLVEHIDFGPLIGHTKVNLKKVPLKLKVPEGVGEGEIWEVEVNPPKPKMSSSSAPFSLSLQLQ